MRSLLCKLFIVSLLLISGCAKQIEKPTLEDLGFIGVLGFDYAGPGMIKVSATVPHPEGPNKQKTELFQATVPVIHEAILKLTTESDRALSTTQLRVILISESLARKGGIFTLIKDLYRDPSIGDTSLVAIVNGSVEKLLQTDMKLKKEINTYLYNLLHQRSDSAYSPFTTIHDLMFALTEETTDPIVPYLDREGNKIKIAKVAIFRGDKMIDLISPQEGIILSSLHHNTRLSNMSLVLQEKSAEKPTHVVLNLITSRKKVKTNGSLDSAKIHISLFVKASILEYDGSKDLEKEDETSLVEEAINQELKRQTEILISKLQKNQVDPMFFGEYVRMYISKENWSKEKWRKALQTAKINVHVHSLIVSTGTIK